MTTKARARVFDLLGQAPSDTSVGISWLLRTKISEQLDIPLADIGDKSLANHLNALINGPTRLSSQTSSRARKAAQKSPLKGELLLWGFGDASRHGEWSSALAAIRRLMEIKGWPVGKTLAYLTDLLKTDPSNRMLTAMVTWLLDGEMDSELGTYLRHRETVENALYDERVLYVREDEATQG